MYLFKEAIILCYGQQMIIVLHQRVPKAKVWAIVKLKHVSIWH
jgi:hypothetical protein